MNLIELHMLQSFPVNCLNRDQFGSPKSTLFGGVPRARVSSQCWKRAIRLMAREENKMFSGNRSRHWFDRLEKIFVTLGHSEEQAHKFVQHIVEGNNPKKKKNFSLDSAYYFSDSELEAAAKAYLSFDDRKKQIKAVEDALKNITRDGIDVAFFGRMVADSDLTLEGAAMFSHAISVNRVDNDLDFFTTVEDLSGEEPADGSDEDRKKMEGSAHMGYIPFNTACYYRYVALNLDLLADGDHLGGLSLEERRSAVETFLRACVTASPAARKNSMLANTLPGFILGIARRGAPLSLANAFETPVKGVSPLTKAKEELLKHWKNLRELYGIPVECETSLPEKKLNQIVKELADYVK